MDAHDELIQRLQALSDEALKLIELVNQTQPELPDEALELLEKGLCLTCNKPLGEGRIVRGCHNACYKAVYTMIDAGEFTSREAIEAGVIAPPKPGGRKQAVEPGAALAALLKKRRG